MKRQILTAVIAMCWLSSASQAHFQQLIPSDDVPVEGGPVTLDLVFTHPMSRGPTMDMARPQRFGVKRGAAVTDLSDRLEEISVDGKRAWRARDEIREPGASVYFVAPQPYWDAAEKKFIIHYAKVLVDGFASGTDWDTMIGLPVEIEPLTRPTGLWTGNLFTGIVRRNGQPVPHARVEIEYVNDGSVNVPNPAFITQVLRADGAGQFSYAMPRAGWWGFAALTEGDEPMKRPDGSPAPVEVGGLIWVKATDMR
jgi:cobalt/nickel transport protein